MLEKSRVTPQRGHLSVSRSLYCLDSLDPVGDVPFHCMLLLGLWGQTKGNELCISPQLDQGPAELAGPALDSVWLCKGTALTCQGSLFAFSQEHCLQSERCMEGTVSGDAFLWVTEEWAQSHWSWGERKTELKLLRQQEGKRLFLLWSLSLGLKQKGAVQWSSPQALACCVVIPGLHSRKWRWI